MANGVFNRGKYLYVTGALSTAADYRALLLSTGYAFDATDNYVSDVVASEIGVAGYSRATLANVSHVENDTGGFAYIDADDLTFSGLSTGETVGGVALFIHNTGTASDAGKPLVAFYDITDTPTGGADLTVEWATPANGGVIKLA